MEKSEKKEQNLKGEKNRFGWGPCTPSCLQVFNKIQWFVVCMSMFYMLEELSHSLVNIAITTLERRYGLTSSQTGFTVTAHHIGGLVVVVGVSYLGGKGHKPRWLASGTFVVGVGCLLFLLPQLISDVYDYTDKGEGNASTNHLCDLQITPAGYQGSTGSEEGNLSASTTLYFVILILGQFVLGVGDTPATTLAAPYIDENVSHPGQTSLYLGIYFAVGAIGAAIGYVSGGQSLTLYVDYLRVDMDTVTVEEGDPYWVGAWWIGFVALTIAFPVVALFIGGYPRKIPSVAGTSKKTDTSTDIKIKHLENKKKASPESDEKPTSFKAVFKSKMADLGTSMMVLFKNPTYVLLVIGGCAQALIAIGMLPFQAKILQEKFNISPTQAGIILSVISVVGQGGGEIIGGLIMRFWRLGPQGTLRFMAIFAAVAAGFSACFFIDCPPIRIAGINSKYTEAEHLPPTNDLYDPCHADCACNDDFYQPVCGADGIMYITPCHAGCTMQIDINGEKSFSDCECVRLTLLDMGLDTNATATDGRCLQECETPLYIFSALLLLQFLTLFATVPAASVLPLRCVREEYGSLAVGVQWTFLRLLGVLPGPVMAGVVIDSACEFWGSEGSCLLYDKQTLSWRLFLCWVVFQAFVVTVWAIGGQLYRPKWTGQYEADMELEIQPSTAVSPQAEPNKSIKNTVEKKSKVEEPATASVSQVEYEI